MHRNDERPAGPPQANKIPGDTRAGYRFRCKSWLKSRERKVSDYYVSHCFRSKKKRVDPVMPRIKPTLVDALAKHRRPVRLPKLPQRVIPPPQVGTEETPEVVVKRKGEWKRRQGVCESHYRLSSQYNIIYHIGSNVS